MSINRLEFDKVCSEIETYGEKLNLTHIGRIFGQKFWQLIVLALAYSRDDTLVIDKIVAQRLIDIQNPPI